MREKRFHTHTQKSVNLRQKWPYIFNKCKKNKFYKCKKHIWKMYKNRFHKCKKTYSINTITVSVFNMHSRMKGKWVWYVLLKVKEFPFWQFCCALLQEAHDMGMHSGEKSDKCNLRKSQKEKGYIFHKCKQNLFHKSKKHTWQMQLEKITKDTREMWHVSSHFSEV